MPLADEIRMAADELRAISVLGLQWSVDRPHDAERYHRVRSVAARLISLTDPRDPDELEKTLFEALSHVAPIPCADAAIFNPSDQILLIRRSDDGLWAMPGGMLEMGETPASGAAREALEEAGAKAELDALIGVYDSRLCGTRSSLQLYQFVFHGKLLAEDAAWVSTPNEVIDRGWFDGNDLPPLSPGHGVRVPASIEFHRVTRPAYFDRDGGDVLG